MRFQVSDSKLNFVIMASFFIVSLGFSASATAIATSFPSDRERVDSLSGEQQACIGAFQEGRELFVALDDYLFEDESVQVRENVAEAIDNYSPILPYMGEGSEEVQQIIANLDIVVQDFDTGIFFDPNVNPEEEWGILSEVGINQDSLMTTCASEGIYINDEYYPFIDDPVDLDERNLGTEEEGNLMMEEEFPVTPENEEQEFTTPQENQG